MPVYDASLQRYSEHVDPTGDAGADPEHAGGITCPIWPGENLRVPQEGMEDTHWLKGIRILSWRNFNGGSIILTRDPHPRSGNSHWFDYAGRLPMGWGFCLQHGTAAANVFTDWAGRGSQDDRFF
ncbi:unnamed protein product [Pleuronectes platessa]|uniref:Uncharacterized protein n=1 Tax=Pleuronectes platessa TaxID=8262 RepID=A0A9N7YSZ9_PLEPL|nr:unnamed protein product [Pleuronectes platessa]